MDTRQARELLDEARCEAIARVHAVAAEFETIVDSSTSSNLDDEHDPEGSTVGFERARVAALLREASTTQLAIEHALDKIADGRYGTCEACAAPISPARLRALPIARLCIACAASAADRTNSPRARIRDSISGGPAREEPTGGP